MELLKLRLQTLSRCILVHVVRHCIRQTCACRTSWIHPLQGSGSSHSNAGNPFLQHCISISDPALILTLLWRSQAPSTVSAITCVKAYWSELHPAPCFQPANKSSPSSRTLMVVCFDCRCELDRLSHSPAVLQHASPPLCFCCLTDSASAENMAGSPSTSFRWNPASINVI